MVVPVSAQEIKEGKMDELKVLDAIMEVSIAIGEIHRRYPTKGSDGDGFRRAVRELRESVQELDELVFQRELCGKTKPPW